jgi:hypothetical protein
MAGRSIWWLHLTSSMETAMVGKPSDLVTMGGFGGGNGSGILVSLPDIRGLLAV